MKFFKHLHLINKHRFKVFILCCRCGFFWRGFVHDLSKYSPSEFFESVKYYCGTHSPIENCRKENGYSQAWLHHSGRNKHHFEYWLDPVCKDYIIIPFKYMAENICDRIAASKVYKRKNYTNSCPYDYWIKDKDRIPANEKMKSFTDRVLSDLKEHGEKFVLNKKYLKKIYDETVINN